MNIRAKTTFISAMLIFMSWVCSHMIAKAQNLSPTALMTYESKWLVQALEQAHYSKVSVDDLPVEAFLDRYFAKLDKQKLYFTEKEVEKFKNKYSTTIISLFKQVIFYQVLKYLIPTRKMQCFAWRER